MRIHYSLRFLETYENAPITIRRAFNKQSTFLIQNLRHPSLQSKKYDESSDIWQARVNRDWRFYFCIEQDVYYILSMMKHPK
jgi:mRNA interferase RelE/StbE